MELTRNTRLIVSVATEYEKAVDSNEEKVVMRKELVIECLDYLTSCGDDESYIEYLVGILTGYLTNDGYSPEEILKLIRRR